MSEILTLPTEPIAPTRINPRISIFYGVPKIGKTSEIAKLPGCMTLDTERGTELITSLKVPINSISGPTVYKDEPGPNGEKVIASTSIDSVINTIMDIGMKAFHESGKKQPLPYKFLAIDTIDKLEEYCEVTATEKYKNTTIGKKFEGDSVLELPNGAGYYHLRNEVVLQIERLSQVCKYLILVSHVKDKVLNKGGVDVSVSDISLTGKLGAIVCAKADVIGFMYREPGKPNMQISFETFETSVLGARVPRLAGKKMELDWNQIFSPNPMEA